MGLNLLEECKKYDRTMAEMLGFVGAFLEQHGLVDELKDNLQRSQEARRLLLIVSSARREESRTKS